MKDLRSVYVRYLPIVFLGAFFAAVLQIFAQIHFDTGTVYGPYKPWSLPAFADILKHVTLWAAIGLGFRQIKAAACALGVALLVMACKNYLFGGHHFITSLTLSFIFDILCNNIFTPGLVFLILCFQKQALRFFWPLCVLALGFVLLKAGSEYLGRSPHNGWFRSLGIGELLKVNRTAHSHIEIDLFYYVFYLIDTCVMFLLFGECFIAAGTNKKLTEGLTEELTTRYTKTGAVVQFFTLRAAISLLVAGIIIRPIIWMSGNLSALTFIFILLIVCAFALLASVTFYYRKFITEYFVSHNKKISWLFWLVNIPVIGIVIFPFVVVATSPALPVESVNYKAKSFAFLLATLAINVLLLFTGRYSRMPVDVEWVVWILQIAIQLVILLKPHRHKNSHAAVGIPYPAAGT